MAAQTMMIDGREFNVWTEGQLQSINRDALKKRCMALRDAAGADRLPAMPRHPEGMIAWILQVQEAVRGENGGSSCGPPASYRPDPRDADRSARSPPGYSGDGYSMPRDSDRGARSAPGYSGNGYSMPQERSMDASDCRSIRSATATQTMMIENREFQVWTEKQLSAINRDALQKRCMDLRDAAGADCVPRMPRHPEGMVEWILQVQEAVTGNGGGGGRATPASYRQDPRDAGRGARSSPGYADDGNSMPQERGFGASDGFGGSQAVSEAHQVYLDSKNAASASRQRNSGHGGLW